MATKPASRTSRKATRGEYIETDTGNKVSRRARIEGTSHIILAGRVVVQGGACLRGDLVSLPRAPDPSSTTSSSFTTDPTSKSTTQSRTSITVGRYTILSPHSTLHPPSRILRDGTLSHYPMKIGENVFIGPGAFVGAASVGNFVHIGRDAVVENGVVVRDGAKVLEESVVVSGMVVPSGVVVGGVPGRIVGEVEEGWGVAVRGEMGGVEGGELREVIRGIK